MQLNNLTSTSPAPGSSVAGASASSSAAQSATGINPSQNLNEQDFLQMLVTELQNQDPTNPLQSTDLAAQLAQFSSVSELATLNSNVQNSTNANLLMTQSISNTMAATLIGKKVRVDTSQLNYDGSTPETLGFNLSGNASDVQVKILNSNGTVVRTIDEGPTPGGDNTVTWDGKDDSGNAVSAGSYTFSVSATDSQGAQMSPSLYLLGTVQGVKFGSSGASLLVNGTEVGFADVQEIYGN